MARTYISATRRWLMQGRACSAQSLRFFLKGAHRLVQPYCFCGGARLPFSLGQVRTALCVQHCAYSTVSMVACVRPCVQHCVYVGMCATVCAALCLWWHMCYRVYSTVSMVAYVLPCVQHCVYGGICATMCAALCLWWHVCYRVYSTVSMVVSLPPCVSHI